MTDQRPLSERLITLQEGGYYEQAYHGQDLQTEIRALEAEIARLKHREKGINDWLIANGCDPAEVEHDRMGAAEGLEAEIARLREAPRQMTEAEYQRFNDEVEIVDGLGTPPEEG